MVREGRRVCEEWRVVLGVGVRLHKGNPGVWKRGGWREDEGVKHTMIHQLWEFS